MKNLFLLLIGFLLTNATFAQKCKFTVNKKDAFSGAQVNAIVLNNNGWVWTSMKEGDKFFIEMTFLHAGDIKKPMATTDSVLVKLADGTVFHLHPMAEVQPFSKNRVVGRTSGTSTRSGNPGTVIEMTAYVPRFAVDRPTYEKLSTAGLIAIRINFTGKPYDLDFTAKPLVKSVDDIMEHAKCILSLN